MENIFIQIAAGFTPAALIFILLSVFSKRHRARNITFAVLCISVLAAGLAAGVRQVADDDNVQIAEADNLRFAYALIREGELDAAKEAITADKFNGRYSEEDTLASARIALLGGKIQVAKALYNKLSTETEEKAAVLAIEKGSMANNPAVEAAAGIVWKAVSDYLKQFSSDETNYYSRTAKSAAYAEAAYAEYLENGTVDSEEVKKALRRITSAYEELPELLAIAPLRLSRLKLQLLTEDFKGIAKSVDEYADYNELLIVSELYMNGYIRPSGFSEAWRGGDMEEVRTVADALSRLYSRQYAAKPREERKAARAQINSLKAFMENPAFIRIETALAGYAESDFAYDRSKVYLQLAKTESYMGNEGRSIEYLDRSLNTVGDCDDAEYTAPMYEIIGIIADKDSPERLKDVAVYTDRILTNTMTVQMADALREPVQTAAGDDGVGGGAGNTGSTDENRSGADFAAQMNTYISQKRMAINIVGVDVSEFDTVKASLNISGDLTKSVDELKELLRVDDCEISIHDFTLEKITYTGANILICADVSGSMEGQPIADLRNAVQLFVESTDAVESVALVAFSSGIVGVWEFGTSNSELVAAAQSLRASGGTDMYRTVQQALGYFTPKPDEINCVILISDGEDNSPAGYAEIRENIGKAYQQKGVTLYSLGLGSGAAGDYLNALAGSTGGKYVYASDSVQIENFFDGIRAQILNSYRLTFRAEDSFRNSRDLRVSIDGESYTYDEFWYTLDGTEAGEDNNAGSIVFFEGKALHGFEEKLIFKGERSRRLNFKGEGFAEEDEFTFELRGNIDYDHLAYEYINGTTLSVTIPAGIACGTYDVRVSVNGRKTVLADGLTVAVQGSEKETIFGDYIFTSYFKLTEGDRTTLSQYVQMNGWLNFRGDVVLTGDLNGQSVVLNTGRPEYVHYYEDTVEGLAAVFVNKDVPVPALHNITLYNQYLFAGGDSGELRVEAVPVGALTISGFLTLSSPGLSVYPDRIEINADEFSTALPFQKELLKGVGLFTFDVNIGGAIGAKSIDLIAEIGSEAGDRKGKLAKSPVNLGNIPLLMNQQEFELKLNTYENEFSVKYIASLPFITDDAAFGLKLGWKWGDKSDPGFHVDEVMLYADFDVPMKAGPVDLTFSDFKFGLKGMTDSNPTLTGGFNASAWKLESVLPGIGKYLGDMADVSVLSAEDAEISLRLQDFYIGASTTIKLLKYIELGGVKLELGKFEYTNKLLGLDSETVTGFAAKVNAGPAIHTTNCDISMQGAVEVAATNRALVIPGVEGNIDIAVKWWVFTKDFHAHGKALLGVQFTHDGDTIFCAKASGGTNVFYIQWSKRRGADVGSKKL